MQNLLLRSIDTVSFYPLVFSPLLTKEELEGLECFWLAHEFQYSDLNVKGKIDRCLSLPSDDPQKLSILALAKSLYLSFFPSSPSINPPQENFSPFIPDTSLFLAKNELSFKSDIFTGWNYVDK